MASFTVDRTFIEQISTTAEFIAFAQRVHDDLVACNWTWQSNSGQVLLTATRTATADGTVASGSTAFSSATLGFLARDVGRTIVIPGAGVAGATLTTTVAAYVSATAVTLTAAASTSVTTSSAHIDQATKSGSINTSSGYEVWAMADSLQGTSPCYLKIEYGTGNTATSNGTWITVGTGTDGAGTITGQISTRRQVGANGSSTATPHWATCGDVNRIVMMFFYDTPSSARGFFFSIERTHNSDGTDNATGLIMRSVNMGGFGSNQMFNDYIPASGTLSLYTGNNCFMPKHVTSGNYGSNYAIYPFFAEDRGAFINPDMNILGYWNTDITARSTFVVTHYGAARTYLAIGGTSYPGTLDAYATAASRLAIRYE